MWVVFLKKGKERKVKNNYPWIFKDELEGFVGDGKSGDIASVFSHDKEFLGKGFFNPNARIAVRMITGRDEHIEHVFNQRILRAFEKRKFPTSFYRVVHGEADGLPGLIIDRYGDGFVIQVRCKGMELMKDLIKKVLVENFSPSFIYERGDFETRSDEDLERKNGPLYGKTPERMILTEHDIEYVVDVKRGQKTGFFLDQRMNRFLVRNTDGKKALDLFCYTGGFSLNLAKSGFEVIGVDVSQDAVDTARENARRNSLEVSFEKADVFEFLENCNDRFDVVVADPPSLIKRKEERKRGIDYFKKLVSAISEHLEEGGMMVLCSCAYQMDINLMIESIRKGVEGKGRIWRVEKITFQDVDHPWIAQIPESLYLKCVWARYERW